MNGSLQAFSLSTGRLDANDKALLQEHGGKRQTWASAAGPWCTQLSLLHV